MLNPLVAHAYQNVWCDPAMDFEYIFAAKRITKPEGVMGQTTVLWQTIQLPTQGERYHVYQIGHVQPESLGLVAPISRWISLASVMVDRKVYIQVYTADGLLFPLAQSYLLFTRDRTLVIAVKEQPKIAPLSSTPLYFRFYSNAFFASARSYAQTNLIQSIFYTHTDTNAALLFLNQYLLLKAKTGYTTLTRNGQYIDSFLAASLSPGDILEAVYDSTVKKVVDFNVAELNTFESTKDLKLKYLLHYSGAQSGALSIDYRDDCDLWLIKKNPIQTGTSWSGVYFHKNNDDAFRQVTHRDYSVTVPYVASYMSSQSDWTDLSQLTLRLIIRNAGFERALVPESHEIHELYKLPENLLVKAMLGIDSTVDAWRADNLEASDYPRLMDAYLNQITLPLVESAYGYHGISKILGDSPALIDDQGKIDLPIGLQANSTMYEYDSNGVMLGWYPHVLGTEYRPVYQGCTLVEGWVGGGSKVAPMTMGQLNVPIQGGISYRFYITPIVNGQPDPTQWQDVTDDPTKWVLVNGNLHWLVDMNSYQTCVVSDATHLVYKMDMSLATGMLQFTITGMVSYPSGLREEPLTIPPGQLDIFLNGYALVENLDYHCDWPRVTIWNKSYLTEGDTQTIVVRTSGFCEDTMARPAVAEYGFLQWNVLSHNDRFNVRDSHVQRVVAAGRTFHKSQLVFAEDQSSISIPAVPNGSPYQVQDVVVPLRNYTDQDTYVLRAPALATDQAIANYLTLKLPDVRPSPPDIISDTYSIFSPFCSAIIYAMVSGLISMEGFTGQYSDRDLKDRLVNYVPLLQVDPTAFDVDLSHVTIHPTPITTVITLSIYQWRFISRAIEIYMPGKVDLTKFVVVSDNWL